MQHQDHVQLIHAGIPAQGGVWADLGSGSGAFTLALADLPGPGARLYSVDKDRRALREQAAAMRARFPEVSVKCLEADFTRKLTLPLPRVGNSSLDLQNCEIVHTKNREESQAVRIYNDKDG